MLESVVLLQPEAVLVSVAHVTTEGHAAVHGLCCHLKPCLWAMLLPESMLMSMCWASAKTTMVFANHTAAEVHVDVCGLGPWHVLTLEAMWRFMVHVVTVCVFSMYCVFECVGVQRYVAMYAHGSS